MACEFADEAASMDLIRLKRRPKQTNAAAPVDIEPPICAGPAGLPMGGKGALIVVSPPTATPPTPRPLMGKIIRAAAMVTILIVPFAGYLLLWAVEKERARPITVAMVPGADFQVTPLTPARGGDPPIERAVAGEIDAMAESIVAPPQISIIGLASGSTSETAPDVRAVLESNSPSIADIVGDPSTPISAPPPSPVSVAKMPASREGADRSPAKPPKAVAGYSVQLASLPSAGEAAREARLLTNRHAGLLRGLGLRIETANVVARGSMHRIRAGGFASFEAAKRLCRRFADRNVDCLVVRRR